MAICPHSADEKAVYIALKGIFQGDNANIRRLSKVRALVDQHSQSESLSALLGSHDIERVCVCAQTLLVDGIFASETKGAARFSGLPQTQPVTGSSTGGLLDLISMNSHLKAPDVEPKLTSSTTSPAIASKVEAEPQPKTSPHVLEPETKAKQKSDTVGQEPILSTSMSNLPYEAQYRLLVSAQICLEHACFEFSRIHLSDMLTDNGWDCPEAIELDQFVKQLRRRQMNAKTEHSAICPAKLTKSITDIRHAAVHRHRLSAQNLVYVLRDAEQFLEVLGDSKRQERIRELYRLTHEVLTGLDRDERDADSSFQAAKTKIEIKREHLQRLEDDTVLRLDRKRGTFRGVAATRIARAALSLSAKEACTERNITGYFTLATSAFYNVTSYSIGLLQTGNLLRRSLGSSSS